MYEIVEKESIDDLQLIPAFVDNTEKWKIELAYATRLGNEFKGKTLLSFETSKGTRSVMTTVWAVVGDHVQLKGGRVIPLNSIVEVNFNTFA